VNARAVIPEAVHAATIFVLLARGTDSALRPTSIALFPFIPASLPDSRFLAEAVPALSHTLECMLRCRLVRLLAQFFCGHKITLHVVAHGFC
jgi:hypothetical protein